MEKKKRPNVLPSATHKVKTGCGCLYVTVTKNDDKPFEVFATLGKAGGCSNCQNEALTRTISIALRYGVPVVDFIEGLKGIQCPNPNMWPENERTLSCPDAIAKVLEVNNDSSKKG